MSRRPLFPPVFAPNVNRPMMDDFTLRAARQRQTQQPAGVTPVFPLPMRDHPMWTGNNQLGIDVPYVADGNGYQTVLKLDQWGFPELWTVALGIVADPENIPNVGDARFGVTGVIEFGAGGAVQQLEVDWDNGVSLSMPMNALSVVALYSNEIGVTSNIPPGLRLRVTLSKGGMTPNAIRSFRAPIIPGVGFQFAIPPFARRVSVAPGSSTASAVWTNAFSYEFRGSNAAASAVGTFDGLQYFDGGFAERGYNIPPTARRLFVSNTGVADFVWVQFHLAF